MTKEEKKVAQLQRQKKKQSQRKKQKQLRKLKKPTKSSLKNQNLCQKSLVMKNKKISNQDRKLGFLVMTMLSPGKNFKTTRKFPINLNGLMQTFSLPKNIQTGVQTTM